MRRDSREAVRRAVPVRLVAMLASALVSSGFVFELELARLRTAYEAGNPVERRAAIRALARIDSDGATALLRQALGDDDSVIRLESAEALIARGDESVIEVVLPWLDYAESEPRVVAAHAIARFRVETARVRVERMLDDTDAGVRLVAIDVLDRLGHAGDALISVMEDSDASIRLRCVLALAHLADPETEPAVVAATRDVDARVRAAAVEALSEIPGSDATTIGLAGLEDRDPDVVEASVRLLGRSGDPDLVPTVAAKLDANDAAIATSAVFAIARLDYAEALPWLVPHLADARLAPSVEQALSEPGDAERADRCVAAMARAEPDSAIRERVDRILARCMARTDVDPDVAALVLSDVAARPTPTLTRALASIGTPDAIRLATALAISDDVAVSEAALLALDEALARAPDGRVVEPLAQALAGMDPGRRAIALRLLGRSGASRALPILRRPLSNPTMAEADERLLAIARLSPADGLAAAMRALETAGPASDAAVATVLCESAADATSVGRILAAVGSGARRPAAAIEALGCGLARGNPAFVERRARIVAALARALESSDAKIFAAAAEAALLAEPAALDALAAIHDARGLRLRAMRSWLAASPCDRERVARDPAIYAAEATRTDRVRAVFPDGSALDVEIDARGRLPRAVTCAERFERSTWGGRP